MALPANMPVEMRLAAESATLVGLIPLAWLNLHWLLSRKIPALWWWLALAFAVSWGADTAARWVDPGLVSQVYPVSQAALVAVAFLPRREGGKVLALLVGVGLLAVLVNRLARPDVLLHTVAWGLIVGLAWTHATGPLRLAVVGGFGLAWATWFAYTVAPGWPTWIAYQSSRALGVGWFCWATRERV